MLVCTCIFADSATLAQDSSYATLSADNLSARSLVKLQRRYAALSGHIDKRSSDLLESLQSKETNLQALAAAQDSSKAAMLFAGSSVQYRQLRDKINSGEKGVATTAEYYIPGLDSMQTALGFLEKSGIKLPSDRLQQIQGLSQELKKLQSSYARAAAVENFVKEREQVLMRQLPNLAPGGQLLRINKEVYYYRQELSQYRELLNRPDKLQEKILSLVARVPAFQQYWQQYSLLAKLFPMPANYGSPLALNGLQTSAQVAALVQQQLGINVPATAAAGSPAAVIPDQYIEQAQGQLDQLKNKIAQAGGTHSDVTIPNFKPDGQHGKKWLQRLTYGFNIQTATSSAYLPSIADVALTLGVMITDNIQTGIGASYKVGMGKIQCIHFSNEGVGLRSYVDIRWRASLWITGGWEYNYLQRFGSLRELHNNVDIWQKSALLGLTKKYKAGKKEGSIQLLYDLLAGSRIPAAQPFKFRTGINF